MQQVVRKQTEYGSQTESRKYRVNGKKLYNTAYFDTCHTHIYTHILPQMHTQKKPQNYMVNFWSQTGLCETYCGTFGM